MSDETFANEPKSLGEARAEKQRRAAAWTPRETLVHVLRLIDTGKIDPEILIISWLGKREESGWRPTGQRYAGNSIFETLALCRLTEADIVEQAHRSAER